MSIAACRRAALTAAVTFGLLPAALLSSASAADAVSLRAEAPIKKPQDLIGKTIATTADHKAMLDLLLAINKIPPDKVTAQVTSPATRNTVFVNGQVDSFISVVIGSPLDLVVRAQQ